MNTSASADLSPSRAWQAASETQVSRFSVGCLLLGTVAALYFQLFIFPSVPLLAQGDQSIYLLNARRMLHGQVIYRDFFDFTLPGTESTYYLLFKLFGVRAWIPNAMLVLLGIGLAGLSISISRKLMCGLSVFLPAAIFVAFPYHSVLDATHHWYSTLAVVAALAITLEKRTPGRLCAAGALCGIATWFTQCMGPAVALAFALFLLWEARHDEEISRRIARTEAALLAGFFALVIPFGAYFAVRAGIRQFLWCTVTFGLKYYPADWYNNWRVYLREHPPYHGWPNVMEWTGWLFIHALVPLVYLAFFVGYRRSAGRQASDGIDRLMLVATVGLFSFLAVALAPSYLRLCTVSLPAIILLVWYLSSTSVRRKGCRIAMGTVSLCWIVIAPLLVQTRWHASLDLPTGPTAFTRAGVYDEYRWIARRSRPGDTLFGQQVICFSLGLRNPTPLNYVDSTDYTRPEQVQSVVKSLDRNQVRYILWYSGLPIAKPGSSGDHLGPIRNYLQAHFQLANQFPNGDRIFERRK